MAIRLQADIPNPCNFQAGLIERLVGGQRAAHAIPLGDSAEN
jgi:hypothetical protein